MRLGYAFKEAMRGFKKSKLSAFASVFALFIALLALGAYAVAGYNLGRLVKAVREKIEIDVFLKDGVSDARADSIRKLIAQMKEVENVVYISKDEAAKIFEKEFGENIFNVLDFNPLPASFKIKLKEPFRNSRGIFSVVNKLKRFDEVEEIKYRRTLLSLIERRVELFTRFAFGAGVLLSLLAVLLVINTIRLTIYAKRKLIKIMQLVGATRSFIMMPFLIQGFLQGLFAGLFSSLIFYVFIEIFIKQIPDDVISSVDMPDVFYLGVITVGCLLGLVGSWISARKFITYRLMA